MVEGVDTGVEAAMFVGYHARAAMLPGMRRSGGGQVEFSAEDMPTAYRLFGATVALART